MVTARPLNKRTTTILIAAVLALGTGLLMYNYLSSVSHVATTAAIRSVVVAARDIPARTLITASMVTVADRQADSVDSDAVPNVSAVVGQMALISIPSGGTLSISKIGQLQLGGLTVRIPRGQRAMSIAIDHVKGVSDLIQAGDHVDVISVTQAHAPDAPLVATILRNKVVLAMGTALQVPVASASPAADANANNQVAVDTVTLSVTPREAKTLALADLNATLRLDLRSAKEGNQAETADPFTLDTTTVAPAVAPAAASAAVAPAASPVAKAAPRTGILIIDGDQIVGR